MIDRRFSAILLLAATALVAPAVAQEAAEALPAWPSQPAAPAGAPNVLVVLTDDTGFAASSTFGGPVPTPTLDRLAQRGLRFNRFHTAAICSASRAALLTGRNPARVGMSGVTNSASSHPAYTTILPKSAATIARILRDNGYNTAMVGKAHITPKWETGPTGPFDRWPTGLGFEYFYGFLDGDTDQFAPQLYLGTEPVEPPVDDPGYILDRDLANRAMTWLRRQHAVQPDKPFFLYYATGTAHSPFQAPREWVERFRGRFDLGWDALRERTLQRQIAMGIVPAGTRLTPRPPEIAAWDSLPAEKKRLYARMMEAYAAAIAYADDQIGRVLDEIERAGELDNTLVLFVEGDNGSSAEGGANGLFNETAGLNEAGEADYPVALANIDRFGGPMTYGHFPTGWAHAMSTPFPYFKRVASHLGATRNAMVLSWPRRAPDVRGEVRSQYHYLTDIVPTILDAAGIAPPQAVDGVSQMTLDGASMLYAIRGASASSTRRMQFYELSGDAAIYADGWLANTRPVTMPWQFTGFKDVPFGERRWELYDLSRDFSQSTDLAARNPAKLAELKALFFREAERNNALPISRSPRGLPAPDINKGRTRFSYPAGVQRIPSAIAPAILNRSFSLVARVEVPTGGGNGMLVTQGGRFGGYGLFVRNGVPRFVYNRLGLQRTMVDWTDTLAPGRHEIRLDFDYDGGGLGQGGTARLSVDGASPVVVRVPATIRLLMPLSETFDVGVDTGTPVSEDYRVPFAFDAKLQDVTVLLR
ncbi:arylsulfatase [Sphingopyxis panaciterrulae]|uniref:Arylsulfatase n=1 Tax=Sphingopyxis panaciterrulae TaxID=462372 RepID=A0A7W9B2K3_9SPHN|nr:arylsulfatase [Sphingopyxis panaciterrulae]MBB5705095.1 arylsulfatase [Sphingopyxis panaciterrulae]